MVRLALAVAALVLAPLAVAQQSESNDVLAAQATDPIAALMSFNVALPKDVPASSRSSPTSRRSDARLEQRRRMARLICSFEKENHDNAEVV